MAWTELTQRHRRARWSYEWTRLVRAFWGTVPIAVALIVTMRLTHRPSSTLWFGVSASALAVVMLWFGRNPQRAVLPGFISGLVPLVLALCANRMHMCGPEVCGTLCLPACTLGGLVAGLSVAGLGVQRRAGPWFWISASTLALLTGAMGCSCIGHAGVAGLSVGFAIGVVPGLLRCAFAGKAS